jgi:hypothetical protein
VVVLVDREERDFLRRYYSRARIEILCRYRSFLRRTAHQPKVGQNGVTEAVRKINVSSRAGRWFLRRPWKWAGFAQRRARRAAVRASHSS